MNQTFKSKNQVLHEQKFKGFPSSKWQDRVGGSMLDLESQGPGSIHGV